MSQLQPGITREQSFTVTHPMTAASIFEITPTPGVRDMPPVWSTPDMISKMELVCAALVGPLLPEGHITVGASNDVNHLAATPEGQTVRVAATLSSVDGRKLTFAVDAFDQREKVGQGIHVRFIVDRAKFAQRLAEKG